MPALGAAAAGRLGAERRDGRGSTPAGQGGRLARAAGRVPAWAITAACGLAYVIEAPPSADLAAAAYRSELFGRAGFTLWDNGWYGGHHLPGYSLLAPALGSWIGVQLLNALSMVAATALFALLVDGAFPAVATRVAGLWFAFGASVALLANRVPFDLGLALGLACLLAARRRRPWLALALAPLCSLASPVAGAFLALALLAWALGAGLARCAWPLALAAAALLAVGLLQLAFPEGGTQPFAGSAFWPALGGVLVIAALIARDRDARTGYAYSRRLLLIGTLLYALALIGSYALPTAVGGNADRLGALIAGPVAACALLPRRARLLLVLAPFLVYWQANAPVADFASGASDPAESASYFTPLLAELARMNVGYGRAPARIEVVPTRDHAEARFMAPSVALARGWERQLDVSRNALFYESSSRLSAAGYERWLSANAISYVALADAPVDYSGSEEARLVAGGGAARAGLREIWRSRGWRLYAVEHSTPLASPPAVMSALGPESFTLRVPRAGLYTARVRFTPYWAVSQSRGCVQRAPGGFTAVRAARAGSVHVVIAFSLQRVLAHGQRCS